MRSRVAQVSTKKMKTTPKLFRVIVIVVMMSQHVTMGVILRPHWFPYFRSPKMTSGARLSFSQIPALTTRGTQWSPSFHNGKRSGGPAGEERVPTSSLTSGRRRKLWVCVRCVVARPSAALVPWDTEVPARPVDSAPLWNR
ncbi:uncharacterized protein LOC143301481 [Babylonia areolata]|uniref:uncharacterized protein LOC143301481 n=1 Tax=Babylonia areolata TaxID=304850 RepID=UPI003FD6A6C9